MAVSPGPKLVLVLLFSCGLLNSSPLNSCPDFCTCQPHLHLNCSFAGLFLAPPNISTSICELDLSNNQLGSLTFQSKYYNLQKLWLGNNSVTHLSLCVDMDLKGQSKSKLRRRWGCMLWAPTLQLLSVEMNQLKKLPEAQYTWAGPVELTWSSVDSVRAVSRLVFSSQKAGSSVLKAHSLPSLSLTLAIGRSRQQKKNPHSLGQQRSLSILDLSFNKISTLEQKDFFHLKLLEELHVHHNLISRLHPQTFEHLDRLKVLDLSFNQLTTLHPVTYISLHQIGADVSLRGNSWICDCGMHFLQRRMVHDNTKSLKTWSIECASPLALSGMNLQELNKEDQKCEDSDIYQDVTVHKGSEILLECPETDAAWWTPSGQIMKSQELGRLLITDITEQNEGLYACLSKSHQIVAIYNVQIHKQNRRIRSVSDDKRTPTLNKMVQTQSNFALAVSLSVIITFIIAFILGVLLQPYICACWQKIKTRKQKPQTNAVHNVPQEEYVNEAYLHCEDVDDFETHRERRVTFTEYTEDGNMQYYDTVAGDAQEGNGAVRGPGQASSDSSDSGSEDDKHKHKNGNHLGKKIQFEIIPDSIERNSLSSQSSNSSVGDKLLKDNSMPMPNTTQVTEEQVQKTTIAIPQISVERSNEIPGFNSEPFADWSPHGNNLSTLDRDLDGGEPFEYSDSVRSGSPISPNSSFKQPILNVTLINRDISFKASSSSSEVSDDEPTHYTVNPDSEEETEKRASIKSSSSSTESDIDNHHAVTWPVVDLECIPSIKRRLTFKNIFVDSYTVDTAMKNKLQQEQTLPVIEQKPPTIKKRRAPPPPPQRKPSSSSSDSEDEIGKFKQEKVTKSTLKEVHLEQEPWPVVNLQNVGKVKRHLDIKAASESFSGSEGKEEEEERIYEEINKQIPIPPATMAEFKHVSGTSSNSENEDEQKIKEVTHFQENVQIVISQNKQPIVKLEQESQWPVINLAKIPKVKQRLDIKERVYKKVIHTHEKLPTAIIEAPKLESRTSSSSDDEYEAKAVQENYYENIQLVVSQKKPPIVKLEQKPQWQVIDLSKIPKVKRCLDVRPVILTVDAASGSDIDEEHLQEKVPTGVVLRPEPGTSSSGESEDEREIKVNQGNLQKATAPIKPPMVVKPDLESQWPAIDLVQIPKVKQRLDITERVNVLKKIPSGIAGVPKPDSGTSSSNESENEWEIKVKQHQEKIQMVTSPNTQPTESQWPLIDLAKIAKVKQHLDIKERERVNVIQVTERIPSERVSVSKTTSETSSSGESEDEQIIKVNQETSQEAIFPIKPPMAVKPNQESQWPVVSLVKVKRSLEFKTIAPAEIQTKERVPSIPVNVQKQLFDTSSSSESEEEQEIKIVTKENLQQIARPTKQPTEMHHESQWPVINLFKVPKVKSRLDIKERVKVTKGPERVPSTSLKVPKQDSGTSSSSESEEEQEIKENYYENIQQVTSPTKQPAMTLEPDSQWPVISLFKVPKLKHRLDIKERVKVTKGPERVPSTSLKVPKQDSGTSSSSESEEEQETKENYYENIQQVTSPTKQPAMTLEPDSQWPVISLFKVPKLKHRLDIKERVKMTKGPERVPSTSLKVPKQDSGTSSSSQSEEEQEIKENYYENIQQVTSPITQPTLRPESQWPAVNLVKVPKLKQRLDIKTTTPAVYETQGKVPSTSINVKPESGTSSSSESDGEYKIRETKQDNMLVTSQNKQPIESEWPLIDLLKIPKVNRHLDIKETVTVKAMQVQERMPSTSIKIPKHSGTSSSSESDNEQEIKINHQEIVPPTKPSTVDSQWPMINLVILPKIKRRLDIKKRVKVTHTVPFRVPSATVNVQQRESDTSSSSESEDEEKTKVHQDNLQQVTLSNKQNVESQWPLINLVKVPKVKQRLDIKTTAPEVHSASSDSEDDVTLVQKRYPLTNTTLPKPMLGTSSSSDSEDENMQKGGMTTFVSRVEPQSQWPAVDFGGITRIKRRLDFKIPSLSLPLPVPSSVGSSHTLVRSSSSSSDEETKVVKSTQISAAQSTRFPSQTSIGIPHVSRRLDIKGPSMTPGFQDSESNSSSDDEKDRLSSGSLKYHENKKFVKISPILTIPHSQSKTTQRIELEKYTVVTDDLGDKTTSDSTLPVVTPELESKWASMNLGVSRFRKRLDITRTGDPPSLPSSPPPIFPNHKQAYVSPTREQNVDSSSSSESEVDSKLGGKSTMVELDSVSSQVGLTSMSQDKQSLNIPTLQNKHASSSSDEDTVDMSVPDVSLGIPRIKRRLNIKAPTPPPSSSSSDDEKVYAHTFSDVTDQRSIEYKRTIMKSYSYDSSKREMYREPLHVQSNPQTPKKLSLDNIKRKLLPSKQQELPPNLRWTSVGSHLSEYPLPTPRRHQDGYTSPPPMSLLPPVSKDNSSDSSSSEDEQKKVKTTLIVTQKTYNPRSVTFNTSPTILNTATFEDRTERRGLSALKAMSSNRKNWDFDDETFTESAPINVDYIPEVHTVYRRTVDVKTKISQPQMYSTVSPASEEKRLADMLYGIPSYKRHTIKSTELPQDPPPPVPSSPLPEESIDFTWRSPQASLSRGTLSYNQKKVTAEESVDDPFYDNPNISAV